jgi:hypothetical protein
MDIETARELLNACTRKEQGPTGDREIIWTSEGREVAYGYVGVNALIAIYDSMGVVVTVFDNDDAEQLLSCSIEERNFNGYGVFAEATLGVS